MKRVVATIVLAVAVCASALYVGFTASAGPEADDKGSPDVVFVPTPHDVVARMLETAKVREDDVLYDLGCGDGRIVVTAARKYGCQGVGFDIDPQRVKESRELVKKYGVGEKVRIEQKNIYNVDLSKASVITLYLLPRMNEKLVPQFQKMKPGSRIVSHAYEIPGYKPDKTFSIRSREDNGEHTIYLWTVPLKKEDAEEKE